MKNTYETGHITISENCLHLSGTTLNLSNIDNIDMLTYDRRSYLSNIGSWFGGLIIMVIICSIWSTLTWIFTIYLISGFALLAYNIWEHNKLYYGIRIQTSANRTIYLKSNNKNFIIDLKETIIKAMNAKNSQYIINMDSHDIHTGINQGIINNGTNNENVMNYGNK